MIDTTCYVFMPCDNPNSPPESPRSRLNSAFIASTGPDNLLRNYENYRDALFETATSGADPFPYQDSIRLIKNFGDTAAESLALLGGSEERLRAIIRESYENLPPGNIGEG